MARGSVILLTDMHYVAVKTSEYYDNMKLHQKCFSQYEDKGHFQIFLLPRTE